MQLLSFIGERWGKKKRFYLKIRKNNTSSNELMRSGIFDLALGQKDRQGDLLRLSESLFHMMAYLEMKNRKI